MTALYVAAFVYFDVPWTRVVPGLRQLVWFVVAMFPPDPGGHLVTYLDALGETLAIAFLGTLLGAVLALPLGVLAARNVIPSAFLRLPIKRFFDAVRGVDTLIWINVVGLGPFAGVWRSPLRTSALSASCLRKSSSWPMRRNRKGCGRLAGGGWPRCDSGFCRRCCR